MYYFLYRKIGI